MTIYLASGNSHKQRELAAIFTGHRIMLPPEAGIAGFDPEETGASFGENALIKARALYRLLTENAAKDPSASAGDFAATPGAHPAAPGTFAVLADDSGLCVDILGGRPGIYSARYRGPANSGPPPGGLELTAAEQNALLLEEAAAALEVVRPGAAAGGGPSGVNAGLRCRFVCAMILLFDTDRFYLAQETLEGELTPRIEAARGGGGFGYDPIVYLPELGRTVAELTEEEKNRCSHRGKAGRAIARLLTSMAVERQGGRSAGGGY